MGGKSSTSTSSVNIPPQVLQRYENVNNIASQVAQQPYQQYSTDPNAYVAPLTSTQQAGIYNTNQYAGAAQPYIQAAANATSNAVNSTAPYFGQAAETTLGAQQAAQPYYGAAGALTAAGAGQANLGQLQTNRYMSPYLQDVVSQQIAAQNLQNAQQQSALQGSAIQAGAFGGDRAGVAQANLAYQQNLANQQALANTLQSGYTQAQNTAAQQQGAELSAQQANLARMQQAGQQFAGLGSAQGQLGLGVGAQLGSLGAQQGQLGLAGAQQYGNLGLAGQTAALQGAQQQLAAGQVAQQTQQQGLTALANQFQQQQSYPFQVAQFLANIAEGTGALSGSTTTSTQPRGFFSARGGRIERAEGGLVPSSQGGAVNPEFAGQGFADGGSPAGLGTLGGLLPGAAPGAAPGFAMGNSDFQFYNPVAAGIAAKPKFDQNYNNIFSQALQQYQEPVAARGLQPVAPASPAWSAGSEGGGGLGTSANQGMSGPDTYSGPQFGGLPGGIGDAAQAAADAAAAQSQADAPDGPKGSETYNQGGRIHRDDGGLIPYGGKSYVPQIQQQQPRQLMTASLPKQNPSDFQQLMAAGNVGMGVENLYKNASNKDSLLGQGFDWAKKQFAYGGDVDPYDDQGQHNTGVAGQHGLNIPQNAPRPGLNPAQGPTGAGAANTGLLGGLGAIGSAATGIAGLGKLGSTVGSGIEELLPLLGLKNGGRAGYATDGSVTDDDSPENAAARPAQTGVVPVASAQIGVTPTSTNLPGFEQLKNQNPQQGSYVNGLYVAPEVAEDLAKQGKKPEDATSVGSLFKLPPRETTETPAYLKFNSETGEPYDKYLPGSTERELYSTLPLGATPRESSTPPAILNQKYLGPQDPAKFASLDYMAPGQIALTNPQLPMLENVQNRKKLENANKPEGGVVPANTPASSGMPIDTTNAASGPTGSPAAGLVPANLPIAQSATPSGGVAPSNDSFIGRNQDWLVPLLSGIGTMASSPSRSLGAALLQGIGGGAKTYEGVQDVMQQRAKQRADIQKITVETLGNSFKFQPGFGAAAMVIGPNGQIVPIHVEDYEKNPGNYVLAGQSAGQNIVGGTPPTANEPGAAVAPTTQNIPHFGEGSIANATEDRNLVYRAQSQAQADQMLLASSNKLDEISSQAKFAYNAKPELQQLALSLAQTNPSSWSGQGPFAQKTALAGSVLNQFGSMLGFGPNYFSDATTDQDINNKITTLLASKAAISADQHAVQALRSYQAATPNRSMDPKAAAELTASLIVSNQNNIDKNEYASEYAKKSKGVIGPRFEPSFQNEFTEQKYNIERTFLQKLMLNDNGKAALLAITSGSRKPEDIERFFARNKVPELARYFVQGTK